MVLIRPPVREQDSWGSGLFGAPRGDRKHQGIDFACYKGSAVLAISDGRVTKIGRPYSPEDPEKEKYRYVQITDSDGNKVRYFYVKPLVSVGTYVHRGMIIGESQGLEEVYPGITDHFHLEVKFDNKYIDPALYI